MKQVNVHEAKTQLSKLLRQVATGEEVSIANRGVPVARLVPVSSSKPKRNLGAYGNTIKIADASTLRCQTAFWTHLRKCNLGSRKRKKS